MASTEDIEILEAPASTAPTAEQAQAMEVLAQIHEEGEFAEEDFTDPIDSLSDKEVVAIYQKLSPGDRRLFREFRQFHKTYFGIFGESIPSHELCRHIVRTAIPAIPSEDAETIAKARHELLGEARLRQLCHQLGFAMPVKLQAPEDEAAEAAPVLPALRFEPVSSTVPEEWEHPDVAGEAPATAVKQESDVTPALMTSYAKKATLLRHFVGMGDENCIITRVKPGTDPMQNFEEDDPTNAPEYDLTIDEELDPEYIDADDLSVASMTSAGVDAKQLEQVLGNLGRIHMEASAEYDKLAVMARGASEHQREELLQAVVANQPTVQGLNLITDWYDRSKTAVILATGVRKYQELEVVKGQRVERDVTSFNELADMFGTSTRSVQECYKTLKYRKGGKETAPPRRVKTTMVAPPVPEPVPEEPTVDPAQAEGSTVPPDPAE